MNRLWRWLRWAGSGAVSAATPLPWLVDVTAARYESLERRVAQLEARLPLCQVTLTRDRCSWLTPQAMTQ